MKYKNRKLCSIREETIILSGEFFFVYSKSSSLPHKMTSLNRPTD